MKTFSVCILLFFTLSVAVCDLRFQYTDLDFALFYTEVPLEEVVAGYMRQHGISDNRMTELLLENFKANYSAYDPDGEGIGRLLSALNNLKALRILDDPAAFEALEDFTSEKWPEEIRTSAVRNILIKLRTDGFPFASNVMTQSWRSPSEHNGVRLVYYAQAKSAAPEEREKYVEFFKWADQTAAFAGFDLSFSEFTEFVRRHAHHLHFFPHDGLTGALVPDRYGTRSVTALAGHQGHVAVDPAFLDDDLQCPVL